MSTHCGVAVNTIKGYETIYVHSDGYPDYMWPMLTTYYNSEELAKKLISFGDASFIEEKLEPTSDFHRFGTPEPKVSMFYHRDRGEDWYDVSPSNYTYKKQIFNQFYHSYIWENGSWHYYKGGKEIIV